ncbi:unnamed protein product, partial [Heterosigma akashiwo]
FNQTVKVGLALGIPFLAASMETKEEDAGGENNHLGSSNRPLLGSFRRSKVYVQTEEDGGKHIGEDDLGKLKAPASKPLLSTEWLKDQISCASTMTKFSARLCALSAVVYIGFSLLVLTFVDVDGIDQAEIYNVLYFEKFRTVSSSIF